MKITLFKILHAVCICIVMSTQSDLLFWTPYCGLLFGSTPFITDTPYYKYSLLQTPLWYGHLPITDNLLRAPLYYGHLSITDTHLIWSLLRIFSLWTPVLCENLSLTDSFMETSLLRTPLYCKYPYLWYGHVFVTDTSQSLLQTPIKCRPRWYGNVFVTDIAYYRHHPLITDTSGTDMSLLRTPLKYTFLLRTLSWTPLLCRHLHITDSSIIP